MARHQAPAISPLSFVNRTLHSIWFENSRMNKALDKRRVSDNVKFQGQNIPLPLQEFKYLPLTLPPQQACEEDKTPQIFLSQGLFMEEGILRRFERGHRINKNDTPTKPYQEHATLMSEECVLENWIDSYLANSFGNRWLENILRRVKTFHLMYFKKWSICFRTTFKIYIYRQLPEFN